MAKTNPNTAWEMFILACVACLIIGTVAGGLIAFTIKENEMGQQEAKYNSYLKDAAATQQAHLQKIATLALLAQTERQNADNCIATSEDMRNKLATIGEKQRWADAMGASCEDALTKPCLQLYQSSEFGLRLQSGASVPICIMDSLCEGKANGIYSQTQGLIYLVRGYSEKELAHEFCHAKQHAEGRKFNEKECG